MKKEIKYTKAQSDAIFARGSSLLVSAAAGSGKTAVLSERILQRISDPKGDCDISRLLIVTFTRAAAGELKERLSKKLDEACAENPENTRLERQLSALSGARISTVHSFCLDVIRQCFYDLGLPSNVRIADDTEAKIIKQRCMREVIDAYHGERELLAFEISSSDSEAFGELLTLCSDGKSDAGLITALFSVYEKIISYPLPIETLEQACALIISETESLSNGQISLLATSFGRIIADTSSASLQYAHALLQSAATLCLENSILAEKYYPAISEDIAYFSALTDAFSEYSDVKLRRLISGFKKPRLSSVRGDAFKAEKERVQALRKRAYDTLTSVVSVFEEKTTAEICFELTRTTRLQKVIIAVLKDFIRHFSSEKLSKSLIDFSDLEHYAFFALVEQNTYSFKDGSFEKTPYAVKLSTELDEIYVDEYQDTNLLQDAIFRAVSRNDNLFTVGDPKQSIYGFRGALPEIFSSRKDSYPDFDVLSAEKEQRIFLSNNFRSDVSVVSLANRIFSVIMNTDDHQIYGENDKLIFSKKTDSALAAELILIDGGDAAPDDEENDFESAEAELVADRIVSLLSEGIITESGEPLKPSDIAVLTRKNNALPVLKRAIASRGIEAFSSVSSGFTESAEILFLISVVRATDNPERDVYLLGAMASPVFGFDTDELYSLRFAAGGSFYKAIMKYAENAGDNPALSLKLRGFLSRLDAYRSFALENSASETVSYIIDDTETMTVWPCSDEKERSRRQNNIIRFFELACDYDAHHSDGLFGFSEFAMNLSSEEENYGGGEGVALMTVHKSKGLEFPVCILCQTGSKYSDKELSNPILTDTALGCGLYLPTSDALAKVNTTIRRAIAMKIRKYSAEEEKRVLYVALTRARQKLIVVGRYRSVPQFPFMGKDDSMLRLSVPAASSSLDLICGSLCSEKAFIEAVSAYSQGDICEALSDDELFSVTLISERLCTHSPKRDEIDIDTAQPIIDATNFETPSALLNIQNKEVPVMLSERTKRILSFEYKYESATKLPAKVSVSEINELSDMGGTSYPMGDSGGEIKALRPDQAMQMKKKSESAAFSGTAMHEFMQFCDFSLCVSGGTEKEAERLVCEGFITREEADALTHNKLKHFFSSQLLRRMLESRLLKRELRFNVFLTEAELFGNSGTDELLVQGVIDCFFENPDGSFTLVDYKTDYIHDNEESILISRYEKQLELYRRAVEKITGKTVAEVFIYSFSLEKALPLPNARKA